MVDATYFDGPAIDQKTVQLLKRLASAICLVEGHIGNATADRVGPIRQFNLLDGADRLGKVFLGETLC